MKRKRAPGAGRKPKVGLSTSSLTFRIPHALRKNLESQAAERGSSIAEALIWHLRRSLNRRREEERDPAMRALCFLISQIAKSTSPPAPGSDKSGVWRSNPFFFAAFKLAVAQLLDALTPPGEIIPPELPGDLAEAKGTEAADFVEQYESPEKLARQAAISALHMMEWSREQHTALARHLAEAGYDYYPDEWHWMPDAAHDLAVNPQLTGQWRPK
jgi:hypothetical protein